MEPKRRFFSKAFKAQIIQECSQPGASIAHPHAEIRQKLGHLLRKRLFYKGLHAIQLKPS